MPELILDLSTFYVVICRSPMKDTTVSFKINRLLKAKLIALANAENRTLSNFIENVLKGEVAKHESKRGRAKGT